MWRQCLLLVCGLAIAWDFAIIHWRGDGLDLLRGAEKAAAQEVLDLLSVTCLDHPVSYYLFARHWRVTSVRFLPWCPSSPTSFRPARLFRRIGNHRKCSRSGLKNLSNKLEWG